MMRIAVVSDTHLHVPDGPLSSLFETYFAPADAIIHCGDITGEQTLGLFMSHPTFIGVLGNMDMYEIGGALPHKRVEILEGFAVGVTHGWGGSYSVEQNALKQFSEEKLDILCFGHSHRRTWEQTDNGLHLLNPGSLFDARAGNPGFAYLELTKGNEPLVEFVDI